MLKYLPWKRIWFLKKKAFNFSCHVLFFSISASRLYKVDILYVFTPCRSLEAAHTICCCWMKPTLCWPVYFILLQVYLWAITVTHISLRGFQWHPCKLCTSKAVAVLVTPPLHPSKVHRKDFIYTLCLHIVLISSLFFHSLFLCFCPCSLIHNLQPCG